MSPYIGTKACKNGEKNRRRTYAALNRRPRVVYND